MSVRLTIIDADDLSRSHIQAALDREGLEGIAVSDKPGTGLCLWLGESVEGQHLPKPVRIGAVLDRVRKMLMATPMQKFKIGPYELDVQNSELLTGQDRVIRLTDKEKQLLLLLCEAKGAAVDRQTLLEKIWGYAPDLETHTLETHIYRLRQKIERNPAEPEILLTDGTGYKIPA